MNSLVKINNNDLQTKEFKGQRVITFKEIDLVHERVEGTANKRFLDNQQHFIEGIDYFELTGEVLKEIKRLPNFGIGLNASKAILITESGYLMLVKSLSDDLAWSIQRELVNKYFRVKDGQPNLLGLNNVLDEMKGTIEEFKSMCKINCSKKRNYTEYIKKRLGIAKVNSEYEQVKARVFLILNINKWEDVDLETSKNILNVIDESITVIKRERPYKQMSYFE